MPERILVVDDELNYRKLLEKVLEKEGYRVVSVRSGNEAVRILEKQEFNFVLTDVRMPGMDGLELMRWIKGNGIESPIIIMSAYGNKEMAIKAVKEGAYDFIYKPFDVDEFVFFLQKTVERERLRKENIILREEVKRKYAFENIVSKNEVMYKIFDTIRKVADYQSTVLIYGESGTGKELVAKAIHYQSSRSARPFIPVNCGAIPENLMESELFGHVKGAFTSANRTKSGLFEEAEGGTLFLDEIGELPKSLQVKILRALQEGEIRRIGDVRSINVNVRVIAATARDLDKEVEEGRFREDLYYRLNVIPINIPPLCDRMEDIPLLVEHFLKKYSSHPSKKKAISPRAMEKLIGYRWPGNVRELENVIERSTVLSDSDTIKVENLPLPIMEGRDADIEDIGQMMSIKKAGRIMEKSLIRKALEKTSGNRTKAARLLEISHRALLYKIKEYGIEG